MELSLFGIFLEGLLSFLSPCVLPLLPLYMSYLAGQNKQVDEEGNVKYETAKVFVTTFFFVLGICFTFVLLGISVGFVAEYVKEYTNVIYIIGGIILIIFGLHELELININILNKEAKLKLDIDLKDMNFIKAFLLGFVFSLGWSPCIGPMLANALMLAATESNGYLYILCYGLGLIIPFLITGLLTSKVLNFLNKKKNVFRRVIKIAGVIVICFGVYMLYSAITDISNKQKTEELVEENSGINNQMSAEQLQNYLINYEFFDQDGNTVKLADYNGKYVFITFTTSWCKFCEEEIPVYKSFAEEHSDEVVCLYVMSPLEETSEDVMHRYIKDNLDLTTLIDSEGLLLYYLRIDSFPTVYVLSPDSKFVVYKTGASTLDGFNELLKVAKE